jgi:hypothetical protein
MSEGEAPARVWVIGSDHWPRAFLRAELIERGFDALGFERIEDALFELAMRSGPRPRLVVVDVHGARPAEKLMAALFRLGVPVVAVAGATGAADDHPGGRPWAALLRRPVTIGAIADVVERALR